jgi:putative transposase
MTVPRRILPGTTYLVTRRCFQRQFLLRPSPSTSGIFLYVLAVAAARYRVRVHALCVLSNHFHMVVTDPDAQLPAFEQYLDSLVARAVNASLGRWESFWAPASYSAVTLTSPEDVMRKVAYVLANPVMAGLVRRGHEWPGLWTAPDHIGVRTLTAPRPKTFFRANGCLPASAQLELTVPPGFESPQAFRNQLAVAVAELEERAARELASEGRAFLGAAKVVAQRPLARPAKGEPRRRLSPRVAAVDKWKRIEALCRLTEFVEAYREALAAFTGGVRDVVFPAGTYRMRVAHGLPCAGFA